MIKKIQKAVSPFIDSRIVSIFFLGVLSGLPWLMIGSALTLWLKEAGISRAHIGFAGFIFGVYAINFLWAPLIDRFQSTCLPRVGPRRLWVLGSQVVIISACCLLALFNPAYSAKMVVGIALIIAIASATQDMAIGAFRVDAFAKTEKEKISAGAATETAGWWTGYAGLGLIPLALSDKGFSWPELYPIMGLMSAIAALGVLIGKAPPQANTTGYQARKTAYLRHVSALPSSTKWQLLLLICAPFVLTLWAVFGSPGMPQKVVAFPLYTLAIVLAAVLLVIVTLVFLAKTPPSHVPNQANWLDALPVLLLSNVIAPLEEFVKRNGVKLGLTILSFIVVFKLGESFLGKMSILFYKEVGYTNTEIGAYSKMVTWGITVAAAIPCAVLNAKLGLVRGLFIAGICMAASNLLFVVIAMKGPDLDWLLITVIVDGITQAWSSIAFVAFISALCSHTFSATQYALMASLGTLGRSTLAAFGGQLVDALNGNWVIFFVITTAMVVPGLVMLLQLRKKLNAQFETR